MQELSKICNKDIQNDGENTSQEEEARFNEEDYDDYYNEIL